METLAETEYQNVYRIKDGVLLIINKFVNIDYSQYTDNYVFVFNTNRRNSKQYHIGCQPCLKELKRDYPYQDDKFVIPQGTVVYNDRPVIPTMDRSLWNFQLKTTGESLSGKDNEIIPLLNEIRMKIIENINE